MRLEKLHTAVCGQTSRIGDFLEWFAGEATDCWCCSMIRGVVLGAAIGITIGVAVGVAI